MVISVVMEQRRTLLGTLKKGLRTISPNCREASRLQSEVLDHALTPLQRFGLRAHLLLCKWCRRYGKQIRFLRCAAHEHPDEVTAATPSTLSPETRERLKRAFRDEAK
jgi:hypothetical protein